MFNFKKISAIAGTGLMIGMTMGVAAAANYPAPFVSGGVSDVAIVYGTGSGVSILDAVEGGSIQSNLQSFMSGKAGTSLGSVSGEAVALFSGGTKLYINSTLNSVRTVVSKADLPTVLADQSFSGNVDATISSSIQIGSNPRITFEKQPTSNDDPQLGLKTSTTNTLPMYNLTATFSKAVNFTDSATKGQVLTLFGMPFTVGSATDATNLVLLKSATKLDLRLDVSSSSATNADSSQSVTVAGKTYTVTLVSGTSTSSTIKVTDSTGSSATQTVNTAASKKIQGLTVAIQSSTSAGNLVTASIIAGSDKVTLQDGGNVLIGDSSSVVDGTIVSFNGGNTGAITKLTFGMIAPNSDSDSINVGKSYTDPVFGTVKLSFSGVNIDEASTARDKIAVTNNGDDKLQVSFNDFRGKAVSTTYVKNGTTYLDLARDDSDHNISVREMQRIYAGDYVIVGNQDKGYLLKLDSTANSSDGATTNDRARFIDVASGDTLDTTWSAEGVGTLVVGGTSYSVSMTGDANNGSADRHVRVNMPDSAGNAMTLFPTIQTQYGAKVGFYKPLNSFNITDWDSNAAIGTTQGGFGNNLTSIAFPNGNGYESLTIVPANTTVVHNGIWNFTADGTVYTLSSNATGTGANAISAQVNMGPFTYYINGSGGVTADLFNITMVIPGTTTPQIAPALFVFEEKDYNNIYNALLVSTEIGANADDGMGVNAVTDTWTNESSTWKSTLQSNSKLSKRIDYWGTVVTLDNTDSDQLITTISYPDEQVYGQLYLGKGDAVITPGVTSSGSATQLGDILVKDSEVSSVSATKNLVVVGGSCINSVAATLLGGAKCGSDFTSATGVGSGQFIIQSFGDALSVGNIALLVAGYDVSDTVNAAKYLETQPVKTDATTKYVGTTSTSATLSTATTTGSNATK